MLFHPNDSNGSFWISKENERYGVKMMVATGCRMRSGIIVCIRIISPP